MAHLRSILLLTLAVSLFDCIVTPVAGPAQEAGPQQHAKALSASFRQAADIARPWVVTLQGQTKLTEDEQTLRRMLLDPRMREHLPEGYDPRNLEDDDQPLPLIQGLNLQIGSGVVVDASGVVLTNHHVVEDAQQITVRFADGQEYVARDVLSDPLSDLAIMRIKPEGELIAARFGDSEQMSIGDWVIAIGSPFELEATVSAGIISGKGRGIDKIRGRLLQTDAAINPGNSGGPLVSLDGEVVGINTAIATSSGGYQGVGFAIPGNRAKWIWRELVEHGKVRRAYLGVNIAELTAADAMKLGRTARSGVWVRSIFPNGAAANAGLRENDIVVEFAGVAVRMPRDLQDVVEQSAIGSTQEIKVQRDGQVMVLNVVLQPNTTTR